MIVTSPGCRRTRRSFGGPTIGRSVWGEIELGARLARVPYLAVTGTNGKTTTTGMLAACLRSAGLDAVACGNIGLPFPTAARAATRSSSRSPPSSSRRRRRSREGLRAAEPGAGPPGLARLVRRLRGGEGADLRAPGCGRRPRREPRRRGVRRDLALGPCEVRWFTIGEPARTGRASATAAWPPGGAARISVRSRSTHRRCAPMRRLPPPRPTRLHRRPRDQEAIGTFVRNPTGANRSRPSTASGSSTTRRRRTRTHPSPRSGTPTASS